MAEFSFASDGLDLPKGAWAKTHRRRLRHGSRTILALTQGRFRTYVFPLCTPAGFCVTSESPADHPHHHSLWIGADHVHALMPAAGGTVEEYTYNFYVDETFQGRAPGRMIERTCEGTALTGDCFEIVQNIEWRGPVEWATAGGRCVALERRVFTVTMRDRHHRIDIASQLNAGDCAIKLGPTRHAYFNVRVADSMTVANGGVVRDDRGLAGGQAISGEGARWVDFSGPVGAGHKAGVTVIPQTDCSRTLNWFVADWGVVTVGPFRTLPLHVEQGQSFESRYSLIVHDGDADEADIARIATDQRRPVDAHRPLLA